MSLSVPIHFDFKKLLVESIIYFKSVDPQMFQGNKLDYRKIYYVTFSLETL